MRLFCAPLPAAPGGNCPPPPLFALSSPLVTGRVLLVLPGDASASYDECRFVFLARVDTVVSRSWWMTSRTTRKAGWTSSRAATRSSDYTLDLTEASTVLSGAQEHNSSSSAATSVSHQLPLTYKTPHSFCTKFCNNL